MGVQERNMTEIEKEKLARSALDPLWNPEAPISLLEVIVLILRGR
jgi:hypothetical protein